MAAQLKDEQGLLTPHPALVSDHLDAPNSVACTVMVGSQAPHQHQRDKGKWFPLQGARHTSWESSEGVVVLGKEALPDHGWKGAASPQACAQPPLPALNGPYALINVII